MARQRLCRGFTLLELILVIAVIGILGGIAAGTVTGPGIMSGAVPVFRAKAALTDIGLTLDQLRYASDRMAFEIRELGLNSITTFTPTAFTFSRTDYAGVTTSRVVTIDQTSPGYVTVSGTSINQCNGTVRLSYSVPLITPDSTYKPPLSDRMCSLTFAYYDQAGAVTTTAANIRYVEFRLELGSSVPRMTTDLATVPTAKLPYAQRTRIGLRNQ